MATVFNNVKKSEDEVGEKYDRCLTDIVTHTAAGLGVGLLASVVFFRRKTWPITLGGGFGLGMAFGNCQSEFRNIYPKQKPLTAVNDSLSENPINLAVEQNSEVSVVTSDNVAVVESPVPVEVPAVSVDIPETEVAQPVGVTDE